MTKSWRPEGWKNPYRDKPSESCFEYQVFERGADTMLEALRAIGWRAEQEESQLLLKYRSLQDMWKCAEMNRTTVVFIPDDEDYD